MAELRLGWGDRLRVLQGPEDDVRVRVSRGPSADRRAHESVVVRRPRHSPAIPSALGRAQRDGRSHDCGGHDPGEHECSEHRRPA
jgi:hypothetical protein